MTVLNYINAQKDRVAKSALNGAYCGTNLNFSAYFAEVKRESTPVTRSPWEVLSEINSLRSLYKNREGALSL